MTRDTYATYILRFPRRFTPELRAKLAYKKVLTKSTNAHIPQTVWFSFLTPRELVEKNQTKKIPRNVAFLKKQMLASYDNPNRFLKASGKNASQALVVTAVVLENLFDLEKKKILLSKEPYKQWVAVAERFGLWQLRYYLEDAIFKNFDTAQYNIFRSVVVAKMKSDAHFIADTRHLVEHSLSQAGLTSFSILNRQKNVYGVYDKMHRKHINVNDIYDIHGFRILTSSRKDCYIAVDVLHRLWPYYPKRLKDYVKHPKPNGYKSIHTVVRGLRNIPIEFQVRTLDMDRVAESGPANHADYKRLR